jgi:hypothetical protein
MFRRDISSASSGTKRKPSKIPAEACRLLRLVPRLARYTILKMEAARSSEMSENIYQTRSRHRHATASKHLLATTRDTSDGKLN